MQLSTSKTLSYSDSPCPQKLSEVSDKQFPPTVQGAIIQPIGSIMDVHEIPGGSGSLLQEIRSPYLANWLIHGRSYQQVTDSTQRTLHLLAALGLKLNRDKSILTVA